MSVTNDMELRLKGNKDECEHFILKLVEKNYFDAVCVNGCYISHFSVESSIDELRKRVLNKRNFKNTVHITAGGPYGRFALLDGLYFIFSEICKEIPTVEFEGTVYSSYDCDGCRNIVDFYYCERKLKFEDSNFFYENQGELYYDYILKNLTYDIFITLFKLDCEKFDEWDYNDIILDYFCCDCCFCSGEFFDRNYDNFKKILPQSQLLETEFDDVINKIEEMNVITYAEFCLQIGDPVPDKEKWTKYTYEI